MNNIDLYFESLKQIQEQIKMQSAINNKSILKKIMGFFEFFTIGITVLSFIPVIPLILYWVFSINSYEFGTLDFKIFTISNFVRFWLSCFGFSAILVSIFFKIDENIKNHKPQNNLKQSLTTDQITFIACYTAYKELELYLVSNIDQHVKNAMEAYRPLSFRIRRTLYNYSADVNDPLYNRLNEKELLYLKRNDMMMGRQNSHNGINNSINAAQSFLNNFGNLKWFHLEKDNKAILTALVSLDSKILPRLTKRENLSDILGILGDFSKFQYSFLSSHEVNHEEEELLALHKIGEAHLKSFVRKINDLSEYPIEVRTKGIKDLDIKKNLPNRIKTIYNGTLSFRFGLWFILILLICFVSLFYVASIYTIHEDNMPTFIIGIITASLASAAVLASYSHKTKKEEK